MIKVGLSRKVTASVLRAVVLDLKDVVAVFYADTSSFAFTTVRTIRKIPKYIGVYRKRHIGSF